MTACPWDGSWGGTWGRETRGAGPSRSPVPLTTSPEDRRRTVVWWTVEAPPPQQSSVKVDFDEQSAQLPEPHPGLADLIHQLTPYLLTGVRVQVNVEGGGNGRLSLGRYLGAQARGLHRAGGRPEIDPELVDLRHDTRGSGPSRGPLPLRTTPEDRRKVVVWWEIQPSPQPVPLTWRPDVAAALFWMARGTPPESMDFADIPDEQRNAALRFAAEIGTTADRFGQAELVKTALSGSSELDFRVTEDGLRPAQPGPGTRIWFTDGSRTGAAVVNPEGNFWVFEDFRRAPDAIAPDEFHERYGEGLVFLVTTVKPAPAAGSPG